MKKLFTILAASLLLVSCGNVPETSNNNSLSDSLTSVSNDVPTDPEEAKLKIVETMYNIGLGNFTLSYTEDGVDYSDIYTKDYIYYGYWQDAIGILNADNTGTCVYSLGVDYNQNVEVFSPLSDEMGGKKYSIDQHTGLSYFCSEGNSLQTFGPEDITYNQYGYCVNDIEVVILLSGLMTQDNSVTLMDGVIFNFDEDGNLTFRTALFGDALYSDLKYQFQMGTFSDIGKSKFKPVQDFLFDFTPYTETLSADLFQDFLVDTYKFTSHIENAKKYENDGDKVMDITYTYDGDAVSLYSYNYSTAMEDSVYYEEVDGEICQKFVDGQNIVQEYLLGYMWNEMFPSVKTEFTNLMPTFYKISDNVYRCFSPDAYRLLLSVTCAELGSQIYTDAVVENGKVTQLIFGFQEYYSGRNGNGDLIHMVIKTTVSEPETIVPPTPCLADESTPAMRNAIEYLQNNNYHASITSSVDATYVRDIYSVDGYFLDLNEVEGSQVGLGYYEDENGDCTFFNIQRVNGEYEILDPTLPGKEYYMSFCFAPEVFAQKEDGAYAVKSGVQMIDITLLYSNYSVGTIKSSTLSLNLDENNLLESYTYDFANRTYSGSDEVRLEYENTAIDPKLKSAIDAYIQSLSEEVVA